MIFPVVVKLEAILMPFPAIKTVFPPVQFENITSLLPVNPAPILTPWLVLPLAPPPVQLEKVIVPVVTGVHTVVLTPWLFDAEAVLAPLKVMVPEVLVMALVAVMLIPELDAVPEAVPVREIFPFPVVVVMEGDAPARRIPLEVVLLAPPVPFNVMLPPPVVDILPTPPVV